MIMLVIGCYILLAFYEYVPLFKQKLLTDFWANITLGVLSFTAAILLCLDIKIPSPALPIQGIITSIFGR